LVQRGVATGAGHRLMQEGELALAPLVRAAATSAWQGLRGPRAAVMATPARMQGIEARLRRAAVDGPCSAAGGAIGAQLGSRWLPVAVLNRRTCR
jgi:hypothetical protein